MKDQPTIESETPAAVDGGAPCSSCAALRLENQKLREALDWQNWPNRREPVRGGYEFYINEEWTGIRDAAMDADYGWHAALRKHRIDPDDERVRVRRVIDDDAILNDLADCSNSPDSQNSK